MFSLWINFDFNFVLPWVQLYFNWDRQEAFPKISPWFRQKFWVFFSPVCCHFKKQLCVWKMYITRANKDWKWSNTTSNFSKHETFSPRWSVKSHAQAHGHDFGTVGKLMMTSSAVKWAWVRGGTNVTWQKLIKKFKKLNAFFDSAFVQSKKGELIREVSGWLLKNGGLI